MAASPDRAIHRAYRLPEVVRTPEFLQGVEQKAARILEERGVKAPAGQASATFAAADGFDGQAAPKFETTIDLERLPPIDRHEADAFTPHPHERIEAARHQKLAEIGIGAELRHP